LNGLSGLDLVNPTGDLDVGNKKGRALEVVNVLDDRLLEITEREEGDMGRVGVVELLADVGISESQHSTVGMMENKNFARSEEMLRDDERAKGFGSTSAGVADDMRATFRKAQRSSGVDAGIHASDYCNLLGRGKSEGSFVAKVGNILVICGRELFSDGSHSSIRRRSVG